MLEEALSRIWGTAEDRQGAEEAAVERVSTAPCPALAPCMGLGCLPGLMIPTTNEQQPIAAKWCRTGKASSMHRSCKKRVLVSQPADGSSTNSSPAGPLNALIQTAGLLPPPHMPSAHNSSTLPAPSYSSLPLTWVLQPCYWRAATSLPHPSIPALTSSSTCCCPCCHGATPHVAALLLLLLAALIATAPATTTTSSSGRSCCYGGGAAGAPTAQDATRGCSSSSRHTSPTCP
jgi:hypothetical protein